MTIDEDETTINDAAFAVGYARPGKVQDWPATYHGGSSGMSFADGHSELHRWKFLGKPPAGHNPNSGTILTGGGANDAADLQNYATEP